MTAPANILVDLPPAAEFEHFEELVRTPNVRIERIVSHGHASPEGFWYEQDCAEWIVVLAGSATLLFEGDVESVTLGPGDYLDIPVHRRHRVTWTDRDQPTVWLAVHYR